jgi:flavodoxin/NAD-dependent dihydropyrimidine dehydrogenase PreA subunit
MTKDEGQETGVPQPPDEPRLRTLIVYFSQTGNTEEVAEAIAEGLSDAGAGPIDVRPIEQVAPDDWLGYQALGVGTPVFYYHEPPNVRDWIKALVRSAERVPVFTFNTNGGNPCNTLRRMQKFLAKKGGRVLDSFECYGYDTYPIFLKSFRKWSHPSETDLSDAAAFGEAFAAKARAFLAGESVPKARYDFVGGRLFRLSWICRKPFLDRFFPKLNLVADLCTRCGACARACPTDNIVLQPDPLFLNRCIHCHLCERICPENAIRCDWEFWTEKQNPGPPVRPVDAVAEA